MPLTVKVPTVPAGVQSAMMNGMASEVLNVGCAAAKASQLACT